MTAPDGSTSVELWGRGTVDMKAGVAAILLAARSFGKKLAGTPGIVLVLTAAEEGGCVGSAQLALKTNHGYIAASDHRKDGYPVGF